MTTVPFQNIPANLRIGFFWAEINNSQANTALQDQRTLIIGQMKAGAPGVANVPVISSGPGAGAAIGGVGSMLDQMCQVYAANDPEGEVWLLPLADDPGATAATGTVTFAGTATAAGALSFYAGGVRVQAPVTVGMTAAQAATALAAAIAVGFGTGPNGAQYNLAVGPAAAGAVVTFTALNKGLAGNDIDLEFNFQGAAASEALPAGLTAAVVAMSGGTVNPSLTTALATLGATPYDFIVSPYTDATSIAALTALMNAVSGRWSWVTQVFGGVFMAYRGTYGALTTAGDAWNDPHTSCMGFNASPSPVWAWAAAVAGNAAASLRADPATPIPNGPALQGVWAPAQVNQFTPQQKNTLLSSGISVFDCDKAGNVTINNLITTYLTNSLGQADNSYLEVETLFTIMAVLRRLQGTVSSALAKKKLAIDGTPSPPGSNIVTPTSAKALLVADYNLMETQDGWVQDTAFFAANTVVQINANNPNRLDVLYAPVLIGQLRIFALLFQFRLAAQANAAALVGG